MKNANWKLKLGLALVIISIPIFLALPLIPFLEMETNIKVTLGTILLVVAEVLFWVGGLLLGKELFTKYKTYLNPKNWFRKKTDIEEKESDVNPQS